MAKFGFWFSSQMTLAESGIFGRMKDIEQTNAIDALTALFYITEKEK